MIIYNQMWPNCGQSNINFVKIRILGCQLHRPFYFCVKNGNCHLKSEMKNDVVTKMKNRKILSIKVNISSMHYIHQSEYKANQIVNIGETS